MTRTHTIDSASLACIMKAANAIQQAGELFRNVTVNDTRQGDLFEPGADQACESFMEEREVLIDRIKLLEAEAAAGHGRAIVAENALTTTLDGQSVYTQGLRSEIERLSAELIDTSNALHRAQEDNDKAFTVLSSVAEYCQQLKAKLNVIGISWTQDAETGEPKVAVNLRELDEAVRGMIDRS